MIGKRNSRPNSDGSGFATESTKTCPPPQQPPAPPQEPPPPPVPPAQQQPAPLPPNNLSHQGKMKIRTKPRILNPQPAGGLNFKEFLKLNPPTFEGEINPSTAY